ncbi:polynucleotide kinase 3 phosphatase-domain-containing protein [Phyllosticta citribraziliensis]|uniref:Polynucleotide kinase 3 phosphatase-domain-containing protein n=1 Tax=Phyllosticta citribraziliensis TaxID=989973 RepID=A0ABR1LAX7_9PEZI
MAEKPPSRKRTSTQDRSVSPPPVKRRQQSTTTPKAVAEFFKPASQKAQEPEKIGWAIVNDSLLVGTYKASTATPLAEAHGPRRVAIFDLDGTLINPASGNKFGRDASDWKWWNTGVPTTLRELHDKGYLVAIVSNQSGINLNSNAASKAPKADNKRLETFKTKLEAILSQLDLPISIYAATTKDEFRKPRPGMWRQLLDRNDLGAPDAVDMAESFFVGDAGGRSSTSGGKNKDFSCSDRDFAANVGIPYSTPEEYFLGEEPKPFVRDFDPTAYLEPVAGATDAGKSQPSGAETLWLECSDGVPAPLLFSKKNPVDVVLLCGSPGAGKSTFFWRHLKPLGYERVNQDTLKTRDRCLKVAAEHLAEGVSVAVDNTNADAETRAHWVKLAQKHKVPIRCVLLTAPAKLCEHNDAVRALSASEQLNPEHRSMLPKLAFSSFTSRFRAPRLDEGFQDVLDVGFKFDGDDEVRRTWAQFWV